MTFFFFVVGLEARREFDMGELRERRAPALPLVAGIGGMIVPVSSTSAFNAGQGLGATDGARRCRPTRRSRSACSRSSAPAVPDRLRAFLLTVVVIDDIVALLRHRRRLHGAARSRGPVRGVRRVRDRRSSCVHSSVHLRSRLRPCSAWPHLGRAVRVRRRARRRRAGDGPADLRLSGGPVRPRVGDRAFRSFREQPTPELARSARASVQSAISPNDRLQQLYHPWTSYVIVPLFALANAGIVISGDFLVRAFTSPVTLGHPARLRRRQARRRDRRVVAADDRSAAAACGRRSAGRPWSAAARSPASASPCRC